MVQGVSLRPGQNRLAQDLAARGDLHLDQMSAQARNQLRTAGISDEDLTQIAGEDRVVRGQEFNQIFALLNARGPNRAGRSIDVSRAQQVYQSLRGEVRPGSAEDRPAIELRGGRAARDSGTSRYANAGLRSEMDHLDRRSAASGDDRVTYAPNELPDLQSDQEAPEASNWFVAIFEFLFQWIPGVDTHDERLQQYGRDLADQHGSDIQAFQTAYAARAAAGPRDAMGRVRGNADHAMTEHLADRFQSEAQGRGQTLSRDDAISRAETVVTAMNARMEHNASAAQGRIAELPGNLRDTTNGEARDLAQAYFPARQSADQLGGAWSGRLDSAMERPPSSHPVVTSNPDRAARAENAVRLESVRTVSYLMALERSGELDNVPPAAIDGLLAAQRRGDLNGESVRETVNALQSMPGSERTALLQTIDSVPADRRDAAWATLGRERLALRASDESVRAGGRARVDLAAQQLQGMNAAQANAALESGTLGLVADTAHVRHQEGRRTSTTDVPMYFHPGIPEARRAEYRAMVEEAYGRMPRGAVQSMLNGEGGNAYNVQFLPEASLESGLGFQRRPDPDSPVGGFFRTQDNTLRLNAGEIDSRVADSEAGRQDAVGYILHESTHYLDDLGNADQNTGYFVDLDTQRARQRVSGDGDLAPAHAHFRASRDRFHDTRENISDPQIRQWYMLGRRGAERTPAEDRRYLQMSRHYAATSGAVTDYGAQGGDDSVRSPAVNIAEWWAETSSHYLQPERRERLHSIDPVGHQAAARYYQLMGSGSSPEQAMRQALRFSLSTEVSAQQGARMLAGDDAPSAQTLDDLDGIATAFEQHAQALDGWQPYRDNADLKAMRIGEAQAGVREGRALLARMDERLSDLDSSSPAHRRLSATRARLDRAINQLETQANRLQ